MWLILCVTLLLSAGTPINAEVVELFDTDKEQVVQTIANSTDFQEAAKEILKSVNGRVLELNPSLAHAVIVKIPLAPPQPLSVHAAELETTVGQLFVIMPKTGQRKPWLILHTKEEETVIVEFTQELARLKRLLGQE